MFDNVRRLFRQSAVYGSGEAVVFAANFLLLPVFTRILEPVDYTALALLLLLQAFLAPLNRLGLDESYLRFYYECESDEQKRTLTGTTGLFLGAVNVGLLAALLLGAPAVSLFLHGSTDHVAAIRLVALNGFITAFFIVPHGLMRARGQPGRFARWLIVRAAGLVAGRLVLVAGLRMGVLGWVLAEVLVSAILFLGFTRVVRGLVAWRFSWPLLRDLLRYGFPRTPYALLYQTMGMSERYFIPRYLAPDSLGIYHMGGNVAGVLRIYQDAVLRAWMPFAFETMRRPDAPRVLARLATVAFAGLVLATLGLAVFAEPLIVLMTDAAFHGASEVAPLLVLGVAVQVVAVFLTTSLNIGKETRALPRIAGLAAVATLAGSLVFIPRFGLIGGALAVGGGQLTLAVATAVVAQRRYHIPYELSRLARIALSGAVLYAVWTLVTPGGLVAGLAIRCGVVALFPLALLVSGIVDRETLGQVRLLIARARSGNSRQGGGVR